MTVKPVQDAARTAGVIDGDTLRRVRGGVVEYHPGEGPPVVTVWFEAVTEGG